MRTGTELLDPKKSYTVKQTFDIFHKSKSDINEHLPTLRRYGILVDHITELGVRYGGSLIAWVIAHPKIIRAYDHGNFRQFQGKRFEKWCKELDIDYRFTIADTRKITIEPTDLLFIDTLHTYKQLKKELELHGNKAKKFIIFHDTVTYGKVGQGKKFIGQKGEGKGILYAINEFLEEYPEWKKIKSYKNCNGLLIIGKD
jgi:hypothetical protein